VSPSQLADTDLFDFANLMLDRQDASAQSGEVESHIRAINL
jgi:hypothetical protein